MTTVGFQVAVEPTPAPRHCNGEHCVKYFAGNDACTCDCDVCLDKAKTEEPS